MAYAFGDSDPAALRLERLADVFEPSSRALLERATAWLPNGRARRAADLGCAHGRTTALVADCLGCDAVTGVDESERFLARAKQRGDPRLTFEPADVARSPLPGAPFDAIFCRFLLSHLTHPAAALDGWAAALAPGGLLLVEEVESIQPRREVFARYLEIVERMLGARGHSLYVGSALAHATPAGLNRLDSRIHELSVEVSDAATLFSLNMQAWTEPAPGARHEEEDRDALLRDLSSLNDRASAASQPRPLWGLRHLVWRR